MEEIQEYFIVFMPKAKKLSNNRALDVSMSQSLLLTFGLLCRVSTKRCVERGVAQIKRGLDKKLPYGFPKSTNRKY